MYIDNGRQLSFDSYFIMITIEFINHQMYDLMTYIWFTKTNDIGNNIIFSGLIDEILNLYNDCLIKNELKRNYIYYTHMSIHMNDSYANRKLCYQFVDLKQWGHSQATLQIPLFIR